MLDTIKLRLYNQFYDLLDLKSKIVPNLKPINKKMFAGRIKPTGMLRNMAIYFYDEQIVIEGSIAKFANGNNIENYDWRQLKFALNKLSEELGGVNLDNAKISRIDVGCNLILNEKVTDYFPELGHLRYHQRVMEHKTTLRYYGNSIRVIYLFYDKFSESIKKCKLIDDQFSSLFKSKNMMRVELQIQERLQRVLKKKDIRVKDLYQADFCKLLLKHWFEMFLEIEKKMILAYPVKIKGLGGFNILMKKYLVSKLGWEQLEFLLSKGVENNCIASKAKSVKLSQLREAVFEMKGFKYQNNIKELIHKMKVMYVEGLKQVYKM
ncbi:phage/plasmid replication domain-containing protein [Cloacibacterium sp. TD35]|uniref:phage/plasmid replication domain-containing protein n=1 Tax=Cloacibacterium sp. TD35 TaxID=2976818 RepID=UPI00237ED94D|nr:phage/plasmid replication protein [Cloacibacterium sp. TD35]WDT67935.1 hypothetical protein N7277_11480 [Cloacibacterium sp. TD35]